MRGVLHKHSFQTLLSRALRWPASAPFPVIITGVPQGSPQLCCTCLASRFFFALSAHKARRLPSCSFAPLEASKPRLEPFWMVKMRLFR